RLSLEHDLFRKPVPTFRDHALIPASAGCVAFFTDEKTPRRLNRLTAVRDQWIGRGGIAMSESSRSTVMSIEAFAAFGGSKMAYIRPIRSEDVPFVYPDAPELEAGLALFALSAADGTAIMITDSRDAAVALAAHHQLDTVSVH